MRAIPERYRNAFSYRQALYQVFATFTFDVYNLQVKMSTGCRMLILVTMLVVVSFHGSKYIVLKSASP